MKVALIVFSFLALVSCGGGGVTSSAQFPNPARYAGVWKSDCNGHLQSTWTIVYLNGSLQVNAVDNAYASSDCTGALLATVSRASDSTLNYVSTVSGQITLASGQNVREVDVDKLRLETSQNQFFVTGISVYEKTDSTPPSRCISYSSVEYTCWQVGLINARSVDGGFFLDGVDLYVINISNGSEMLVDQHFRRAI